MKTLTLASAWLLWVAICGGGSAYAFLAFQHGCTPAAPLCFIND